MKGFGMMAIYFGLILLGMSFLPKPSWPWIIGSALVAFGICAVSMS